MIWPTEAKTVYLSPRYLLIVFAFEGDSTTIRVLFLADNVDGFEAMDQSLKEERLKKTLKKIGVEEQKTNFTVIHGETVPGTTF